MEDNLKILKAEYLSIHWSYLPQILNLSSENKQKSKMFEMQTASNGRLPPLEDGLKLLKVEYLSNRWLDLPPILILSSEDETKIKKILERKATSKIEN